MIQKKQMDSTCHKELTTMKIINKSVIRSILKHKLSCIGLCIIFIMVFMAIFAPILAPYDPNEQDLYRVLEGPSYDHLLGTDDVGRDLLSRIIYGSRISLPVGVLATLFSAIIGIMLGLISGFKGGIVDMLIMRITDTFMCIPSFILLLVMASAIGPGLINIILVVSLLGWTSFARITRGQVLLIREMPYIEASIACGASTSRIMFRHLLPNVAAPIIVTISLSIGSAIMLESGAAFFGLSIQPPTPSWGKALRIGYSYLEIVPLFSIAPGVMITLAVLAFNFLGDGLRDVLDPHLRGNQY